jgi:hypothetical protein
MLFELTFGLAWLDISFAHGFTAGLQRILASGMTAASTTEELRVF